MNAARAVTGLCILVADRITIMKIPTLKPGQDFPMMLLHSFAVVQHEHTYAVWLNNKINHGLVVQASHEKIHVRKMLVVNHGQAPQRDDRGHQL